MLVNRWNRSATWVSTTTNKQAHPANPKARDMFTADAKFVKIYIWFLRVRGLPRHRAGASQTPSARGTVRHGTGEGEHRF